jgi:hypothetical protein
MTVRDAAFEPAGTAKATASGSMLLEDSVAATNTSPLVSGTAAGKYTSWPLIPMSMSRVTDMPETATVINRAHGRTVESPEGLQPSFPATYNDPLSNVADKNRSSFVATE